MKQIFIYTLLSFFLTLNYHSKVIAQSSILEDQESLNTIKQAIDQIYNLNFAAADPLIAKLERKIPDYPGLYLLKAFYTSWKYRPLKKNTEAFTTFEEHLNKALSNAEKILDENEESAEANFFIMASHAYLAELYVNNGSDLKALGEAKTAYKYIKKGFDLVEKYPDFYFSSGIYDYYREKYPEENPFFKPFLWFFRSGDKEEGLKMLKQGSSKAVFARVECLTYLFHIYLRYEGKPYESLPYSRQLNKEFPNNLIFKANYVENLLKIEKYAQALPHIQDLMASGKDYYKYLGEIFYGIYNERLLGNYPVAKDHFIIADKLGEKKDDLRLPHYDSILYLELGKTYDKMGNKELAKECYKKSMKTAEYSTVRKEAEEMLKK